jgi:hypothetical protein
MRSAGVARVQAHVIGTSCHTPTTHTTRARTRHAHTRTHIQAQAFTHTSLAQWSVRCGNLLVLTNAPPSQTSPLRLAALYSSPASVCPRRYPTRRGPKAPGHQSSDSLHSMRRLNTQQNEWIHSKISTNRGARLLLLGVGVATFTRSGMRSTIGGGPAKQPSSFVPR